MINGESILLTSRILQFVNIIEYHRDQFKLLFDLFRENASHIQQFVYVRHLEEEDLNLSFCSTTYKMLYIILEKNVFLSFLLKYCVNVSRNNLTLQN